MTGKERMREGSTVALGIIFIHAETGKWMGSIGKAVKNISNHFKFQIKAKFRTYP